VTGELCDRAHEVGRRKKKGMAPGNKADTAKSDEAVKRRARTRCHSSASALIFPGRRRRRRRRRVASPHGGRRPLRGTTPSCRGEHRTCQPYRMGRDLRTLSARRSVQLPHQLVQLIQSPGSGFSLRSAGGSWSGVRDKHCYLTGGWRLELERCEKEKL